MTFHRRQEASRQVAGVAITTHAEARGAGAAEVGEEATIRPATPLVSRWARMFGLEVVGRARRAVGVGLAHDVVDRRGGGSGAGGPALLPEAAMMPERIMRRGPPWPS
jgi:hypothetical protein